MSHEESQLNDLLDEAKKGEAVPPPGFTASVMRRVAEADGRMSMWRRWRRRSVAASYTQQTQRNNSIGGDIVIKKVLISTVAIAVALLGVAYFTGYPPILNDATQGSIGTAQRYSGKQMSDKDVVLGDAAAQEFLQSDTFNRLMKNPEAVALLRRAISDTEARTAMASADMRQMLENAEIRALLIRPEFAGVLARPAFMEALRLDIFADALQTEGFAAALLSPQVQAALLQRDAKAALNSNEVIRHLSAEARVLFANEALRNRLAAADLAAALTSAEIRPVLLNAELISQMTRRDIRVLFNAELVAAARRVEARTS